MLEPAGVVVPRCLAGEAAACYTDRMDKQKLLVWMEKMESLALCAVPTELAITKMAHRYARLAREAFAGDANCASLRDPPEAPPPIDADVIRKRERAATVEDIADALVREAQKIGESLTTAEQRVLYDGFAAAARFVRGRFG